MGSTNGGQQGPSADDSSLGKGTMSRGYQTGNVALTGIGSVTKTTIGNVTKTAIGNVTKTRLVTLPNAIR